jgi:hypothetical protein
MDSENIAQDPDKRNHKNFIIVINAFHIRAISTDINQDAFFQECFMWLVILVKIRVNGF